MDCQDFLGTILAEQRGLRLRCEEYLSQLNLADWCKEDITKIVENTKRNISLIEGIIERLKKEGKWDKYGS